MSKVSTDENMTAILSGGFDGSATPMDEQDVTNQPLLVKDVVKNTLGIFSVPFEAEWNITSGVTMPIENIPTPTHITSDYVEIGILCVIFLVGCTINGCVFSKLWRQYTVARRQNKQDVKTAVLLFKLHLTVSNLLVLVSYCPTKVAWLIVYSWPFGNAACKALHFIWLFCFCLSSNIIAAISFDRSLHVWRLCQMNEGKGSRSSAIGDLTIARCLLSLCWGCAAVCAAPQLLVFEQIVVSPTWAQCTTVWRIADFNRVVGHNYTLTVAVPEDVYRVFHMLTVFWLPFAAILLSYAYIVLKLLAYSCRPYSAVPQGPSQGETNTTRVAATGELGSVSNGCAIDGEQKSTDNNNHELVPLRIVVQPSLAPNHLTVSSPTGDAGVRRLSTPQRSRVPAWRLQMRTKMFRTAATIVLCYCVCWGPYSAITVVAFVDNEMAGVLDEMVNWLKCFTMINAVLNPFLYGFQNPK